MADENVPSRAVGVVMAGGHGERMRASGEQTPKPMVAVLGAPLVERNVMSMLRAGLVDIRVVVAAGAAVVADWASGRGATLAAAAGATLTVVEEREPLGNCGGLALAMEGNVADALLVFADNLTDLDLAAMLAFDAGQGAALTLAVHAEPFRLPYGVVEIADGRVAGYREKPTLDVTVSSGLAVVSAEARALLSGPAGLSDLASAAMSGGLAVAPYPHRANWLDVNDVEKVGAATLMVSTRPDRFELFWPEHVLAGLADATQSTSGQRPPDTAAVRIDDVDPDGTAVRVDVALARRSDVGDEGWRRVQALRAVEGPTAGR